MINEETVYKIKLVALNDNTLHRGDEWAKGTNIFKRGGSGKTWTSKKLVNKSFNEIVNNYKRYIGVDFNVEIITFNVTQVGDSNTELK